MTQVIALSAIVLLGCLFWQHNNKISRVFVTQNKANSPLAIYNALTGDSQFMSYVGQYTFKAGNQAVDSISIMSPGSDLPNLKSQTGLEVIIHDVGDVRAKNYVAGAIDPVVTWRVFLIAWENATGETMTNAAKRIVEMFGNVFNLQTVATPDGLGSLVQTLVLIPSDAPILTEPDIVP